MRVKISKRQTKLIAESHIQYTDEKIKEFYLKGKNFLEKGINAKNIIANRIMVTTISDLMNEASEYNEIQETLSRLHITAENLATQLYRVVESYDINERPQIISDLEFDVVNIIDSLKDDLDELNDIIKSLFDSAKDIKRLINP